MTGNLGNLYRFPNNQNSFKWVGIALALFLALFILSKLLIIVTAGTRVVVFNSFSGVEERTLNEGMSFLIPFIQTPTIYDVRTQTYTLSNKKDKSFSNAQEDAVTVHTADGQEVKMDISVRYHLIPTDVWKLHQEIGRDYEAKIIRPQVRSTVRKEGSKYQVIDIYSGKRAALQQDIEKELQKSFLASHIQLDEVLIRNLRFSETFTDSIERKQVALQEAERMNYILQKEEAEKKRKIIEASGEAEAIRIRAEALRRNPQLIQYEYVQKLSPKIKAIITDQNAILNLGDFLMDSKTR